VVKKIHLDYETFSELDVRKVGAFKYAEHASTRILIMCWAFDDGPVHVWADGRCSDEDALEELFEHVRKGGSFGAHNAQFEYCVWNFVMRRHFDSVPMLRVKQLNCTAARAAMCGLPRKLEKVGEALGLDVVKNKEGTALIKLFSQVRKPTKKNPATRIYPKDEPAKFKRFIHYCRTDVSTERELDERIPQLSPFEREAFRLDYVVNQRGIPIDVELVRHTLTVVAELERRIKERATELTGGTRPTQRDKLLHWLEGQGYELENLQAKTITTLLTGKDIDPLVRALLLLRVEASKASVKKLAKMLSMPGKHNRARGAILYYGAHTGRDAGKILQPQNFIRGLPDIGDQIKLMQQVFSLLEHGADADVFEWIYNSGDPEDPAQTNIGAITAIAMCMRGFICAPDGWRLLVVDYAQIEARLLVWLAEQMDAVQEYRDYDRVSKMPKAEAEAYRLKTGRGWDRYVLMGAFLFGIKPHEVTKEQRRIAKNLVLGCGFQLGWKKFIEYCAKLDLIIEQDMSKRAVGAFREKHEKVEQYWFDVERCAIAAVKKRGQRVHLRNVSFYWGKDSDYLTIRLPSGRDLFYPFPEVRQVPNPWRKGQMKDQLSYMTAWKGVKWVRQTTYGGSLVENIVQGIARDVMVIGVKNAEANEYPVVLKVHDEMLACVPVPGSDELDCTAERHSPRRHSIQELEQLVTDIPEWIGDCPVASEGFETVRYRKG
jgi:DNA polymerase